MPLKRRVIRTNNANMKWLQKAVDVQLPTKVSPGRAMHMLATMFHLLSDAKQREDKHTIQTLKLDMLRLIKVYSLSQLAASMPHDMAPLIAMIDDLKRDPPKMHTRLGRTPRNIETSEFDTLALALFTLNPLGGSLKELYHTIYPYGVSKHEHHRVPAEQSILQHRSHITKGTPVFLVPGDDDKMVPAKTSKYMRYAVPIHHESGLQFYQLASYPCRDPDPLYKFKAQAWAMREYAILLEKYHRTECPFMFGVISSNNAMGEATVENMRSYNVNHADMKPYLLCYRSMLGYHPHSGNRSQSAFSLPYFERIDRDTYHMFYTHLHHPILKHETPKPHPRIIDVYKALEHELKSNLGYGTIYDFAREFNLPPITVFRHDEWPSEEDTNPNNPSN